MTWQAETTLATLAQTDHPLVIAQRRKCCFVEESIARGQQSLEEVMVCCKASKGHYTNMTHKKAGKFGLARGPDNYWVMVLAAPC